MMLQKAREGDFEAIGQLKKAVAKELFPGQQRRKEGRKEGTDE
jgi:hypothetical protein